jgi:hypothetical protein
MPVRRSAIAPTTTPAKVAPTVPIINAASTLDIRLLVSR